MGTIIVWVKTGKWINKFIARVKWLDLKLFLYYF